MAQEKKTAKTILNKLGSGIKKATAPATKQEPSVKATGGVQKIGDIQVRSKPMTAMEQVMAQQAERQKSQK